MSDERHAAVEGPVNADVRHERDRVDAWGVVLVGLALAGAAATVHLILWGYFARLRDERLEVAAKHPAPPAAAIQKQRPQVPRDIPAPRLQIDEVLDLDALKERDEARLKGYGWADAKEGRVRLPIDVALRELSDPKAAAARGIRARPLTEGKP